jgi:hypothetical protein
LIVNCCEEKKIVHSNSVLVIYFKLFINIAHTLCLIDFAYFFLSKTSLTHIICWNSPTKLNHNRNETDKILVGLFNLEKTVKWSSDSESPYIVKINMINIQVI